MPRVCWEEQLCVSCEFVTINSRCTDFLRRHEPDLQPVSLMDMGFAIICPLARHRMPQIRFLYIGSRLCSALLSGPASRRVLFHPCASLSLHVHHVVKRTYTS